MNPKQTLRLISQYHEIPLNELVGEGRTVYLSSVRNFAAKFIYENFLISTTEIGSLLNRDHSTIIQMLRKFDHPPRRLKYEKERALFKRYQEKEDANETTGIEQNSVDSQETQSP